MPRNTITSELGGLIAGALGEKTSSKLAGGLRLTAERIRKLSVDSELRRSELVNFREIPTHMTRAELTSLYDLALTCGQGAVVAEVGSYYGASSCYIGTAIKRLGGQLICVDTWNNQTMPEGNLDTLAAFTTNTASLTGTIRMLRKRSEDLTPQDLPSKINMVFLDGDHGYTAVREDVRILAGSIVTDGILAFHDVRWFAGVSRVVGELLATGEWRLDGNVDNLAWLRKSAPSM